MLGERPAANRPAIIGGPIVAPAARRWLHAHQGRAAGRLRGGAAAGRRAAKRAAGCSGGAAAVFSGGGGDALVLLGTLSRCGGGLRCHKRRRPVPWGFSALCRVLPRGGGRARRRGCAAPHSSAVQPAAVAPARLPVRGRQ